MKIGISSIKTALNRIPLTWAVSTPDFDVDKVSAPTELIKRGWALYQSEVFWYLLTKSTISYFIIGGWNMKIGISFRKTALNRIHITWAVSAPDLDVDKVLAPTALISIVLYIIKLF